LNEKLDKYDKTGCHNPMASISHEKALCHKIGKRLQTKRLLAKPGKAATQILQNTPRGKCRSDFMGLKKTDFFCKPNARINRRASARPS
jgi:hypothetical protein